MTKLNRHKASLQIARNWQVLLEDAKTALEICGDDPESLELLQESQENLWILEKELNAFELQVLLTGPHASKGALLTLISGAGGTEAQDWAQMLQRMYLIFAEGGIQGSPVSTVEEMPGEEAGIKSATLKVEGEFAYGDLLRLLRSSWVNDPLGSPTPRKQRCVFAFHAESLLNHLEALPTAPAGFILQLDIQCSKSAFRTLLTMIPRPNTDPHHFRMLTHKYDINSGLMKMFVS